MANFNRVDVSKENFQNVNDFLEKTGLNWTVSKKALQVAGGKTVPNLFGIVRSDNGNVLGTCTKKYKPVSNIDLVMPLVEHLGGAIAGGTIDGGSKVFAQFKGLNPFSVGNDDEIIPFITLIGRHDAMGGSLWGSCMTRIVCQNTFMMATKAIGHDVEEEKAYKHKHGREFTVYAVEEIQRIIAQGNQAGQLFKESGEFLASKEITDKSLLQYFSGLFQPDIKDIANAEEHNLNMRRVQESYVNQPGKNLSDNTYWTAFNAVTYHLDHVQGREGRNVLIGPSANLKLKAFNSALEMAKAA